MVVVTHEMGFAKAAGDRLDELARATQGLFSSEIEAALLAGLSSAAAARIAPLDGLPTPPSRPLEAAERRERRKRRKRNRRRRIRRGGAAADSLSDGSLTTGSDSDSDGDLELERANELGEDELLDEEELRAWAGALRSSLDISASAPDPRGSPAARQAPLLCGPA